MTIDPQWMKAAIRYVVAEGVQPSFADLAEIPGFAGDYAFGLTSRNVCFWPWTSRVAAEALTELIQGNELGLVPCRAEVYDFSQTFKRPPEPLADSWGPFEELHFAPVIVVARNIT
jgi:hypothetical protein